MSEKQLSLQTRQILEKLSNGTTKANGNEKLEAIHKAITNSEECHDFIEKEKLKVVDLKFVDIYGQWHHFSTSVREFKGAP